MQTGRLKNVEVLAPAAAAIKRLLHFLEPHIDAKGCFNHLVQTVRLTGVEVLAADVAVAKQLLNFPVVIGPEQWAGAWATLERVKWVRRF